MSEATPRPDPANGLPLFSLRGVQAAFDGRTVLDVDRLDIAERRITVLVGENGSGKTTLLRLLNGLIAPSAGTIEVRGAPSADAVVRRDSVLVHQAPLLFRGSVAQNVRYGLSLRRVPRPAAARRVRDALARVGLSGFEARRASALSGGEKQRVALARALVLETPVLLLDEPTANLDPDSRAAVERIILDAAASGTTVILSTHATDTGYRLCDDMLRLEAGRIVPLEENIIKGRVEATDERMTRFRAAPAPGGSEGPVFLCPARQGDFRVAVISMHELILSDQHLASSARNELKGCVSSMEPVNELLRVTVDCGILLRALITPAAAEELGVVTGRRIVVTFKASAVRLY